LFQWWLIGKRQFWQQGPGAGVGGCGVKAMKNEDIMPLRPVGLALAAVVAGLGAGKAQATELPARAPLEPADQAKTYFVDPTNHPGFEEDAEMVVGPSAPVAPFGNAR
jgi:hypothetical protein